MDGVPIENSGGEGTEASHWEKRVMNGMGYGSGVL